MKRRFIYLQYYVVPPKVFVSLGYGSYENYSGGLTNTGQVWGWGYNGSGELGINSTTNTSTPVSILGNKKTFCTISSGTNYLLSIDKNGQVWGWGNNAWGQLGINSTSYPYTPLSILGGRKTFCFISAGIGQSSGGIDKNGQVWCWGKNTRGELGNNSVVCTSTPVSILGNKKTFCNINIGVEATYAIDKNGQLWGWGYNTSGVLGNNSSVNTSTPVSILGAKKTFCDINGGQYFAVGIDKNGQVWTWGSNSGGSLGTNDAIQRSTPVSILGAKKTFCGISAYRYAMGIDNHGQVWGWGYNIWGGLGNGTILNTKTPVSILGSKKTFCGIAVGESHTIALDHNNKIWSWGGNNSGQLGINQTIIKYTPISILGSNKTFCSISSSNDVIGLDKNGRVWGWGYNNFGELGTNSSFFPLTPVSILGVNKTFCNISSGQRYTALLDKNGQVWGLGYNDFAQLGDNTKIKKSTPVSILGNKKTFCKINAYQYSTSGIDKNGQLWSWGLNSNGQLGNNSLIAVSTPVSILGAKKTFCSITGGQYYTIGIDKNGQVWGWGYNLQGQLGINSVVCTSTPVSILGAKKTFCGIDSSNNSLIGVDKNGQVWGWGSNQYGVLGVNSKINKSTPVSILGNKKTFCVICVGFYHAAGIDKNGQVWTWGLNQYGQLGTNKSTASQLTPVSILGTNKTFCRIYSGLNNIIGIDNHNAIWTWGYNDYGQLGINETGRVTTPVMVSTI